MGCGILFPRDFSSASPSTLGAESSSSGGASITSVAANDSDGTHGEDSSGDQSDREEADEHDYGEEEVCLDTFSESEEEWFVERGAGERANVEEEKGTKIKVRK